MGDKQRSNSRLDTVVPQHPLPEEIRKMQRDDTVCKFCGVSYLIHNEIKNLEDKLKAAEEELKNYRGLEEREENLKYEIRKLNMDLSASAETIEAKNAIIGTLNASLKLKDDEIRIIENTRKILEGKLGEVTEEATTYKLKHGHLLGQLPAIVSAFKDQKESYHSLKDLVRERDAVLSQECETINSGVSQKCSKLSIEFQNVNSKIHELEKKLKETDARENDLRQEIKTKEAEIENLSHAQSQHGETQVEVQALKGKLAAYQTETESLRSAQRNSAMESDQYKEQIKKVNQEMEQLQSQFRAKELQSDQMTDKLRKELNQKEFDLDAVRKDLTNFRRKLEDQRRLEEEIQKKASTSTVRVEEMREQMERAKGDLEALKKEREMMITAHQNQIEQLRESFKRRISEADKWPERMEATINKERQKHINEMEALEIRLKESFVMELQIEKQKHQALMEKYLSEGKENEHTLRSQLQGIGSKHKSEIGELHKQIAETKARSRESENTLRKEIENLKSIIRDLEGRLGKVHDGGGQDKLLGVKTQLIETQTILENKNQECKKLDTQLTTAKEEIAFLQETVRRECEERFQLTDALAQCKEDLLVYRKPPGGYSSRPTSGRSLSSSQSVPKSEEIALFKKAAARVPQPPPNKNYNNSSTKDAVPPPNVSMGFEGDGARTPGRGVKGGNVSDQRKRIANAVGRN